MAWLKKNSDKFENRISFLLAADTGAGGFYFLQVLVGYTGTYQYDSYLWPQIPA